MPWPKRTAAKSFWPAHRNRRELLHLLDLETLWALYDTRKEAIDALSAD